jgi:VanZ family protein
MTKMEQPAPPSEGTSTRLVFPILLIVTVFFASGTSLHVNLPDFHSPDKLVHLLIFGLMATLVIRVAYNPKRPWRSGLVAILATSLYGIVDEFRQSFTPG